MTGDEFKTTVSEAVKEQVAPLLEKQKENEAKIKEFEEKQKAFDETQRKYADIFDKKEQKDEKKEPGMTFTRVVKCLTLAKNDPDKALFYALGKENNSASAMYPEDKEVKALLKQLSATTPSEGGLLITEQYSRDIIPLLLSKVAIMELGARRIPMPGGNLNIPKLTGGATSYYVGENQNATKSQQTFGNVKLSSKKLITLVPVSNDLIRNSSPEADTIVRDDMIQQMRLKMDYVSLYGSGTSYEPMGIKNNVLQNASANITVATGAATLTADIPGLMIGSLMTNNAPMISCGWVFNSRIWSAFYNLKTTTNQYIYRPEMDRGMLNGFPFKVSNQITTANATAGTTYSDIAFGDFSEFLIGDEMSFEVMASNEASWYDGSSLQSAFSLDQTVIKITAKHDFALRHAESFLVWQYPYE
ncbi:MAG: phage major capsid protein [Eubacteriales bacterium]|nr:phage major capsid protein [Eubacteriales bacterium]